MFKFNKYTKFFLGIVIIGIVIFFVLDAVHFQLDQFSELRFSFSQKYIYWLIISLFFIMTSLVISAVGWVWIINILNNDYVSYPLGIKVFFSSQLGRYIPGKIWTFIGRFILCKNNNISKSVITESIIYEIGMSFFAASIISGFILILNKTLHYTAEWLCYGIITICIFSVLGLKFFPNLLNWFLLKTGKKTIKTEISYRILLFYFFLNILLWFFMGYGIYFLARSVIFIPFNISVVFPGFFCIAWLGGFLSFLTPSGIGVREGILVYFLSQFISPSNAIIVAVFSRIWLTLAEFLCLFIALGISGLMPVIKNNGYQR